MRYKIFYFLRLSDRNEDLPAVLTKLVHSRLHSRDKIMINISNNNQEQVAEGIFVVDSVIKKGTKYYSSMKVYIREDVDWFNYDAVFAPYRFQYRSSNALLALCKVVGWQID